MVVPMPVVLDHDRIFGALSDATRRDIVRRAIAGEEGVAELAAHYPMSFADGIANLVAEADPALELRESIEVGVKLAHTAADQGE
jgi:hypothetical protein